MTPPIRSTQQIRDLWGSPCDVPLAVVHLHSGARVSVREPCRTAFRALDLVMQSHGYASRATDTGGYNCRAITGGKKHSLHAYGLAADYNWSSNPYRSTLVTDMPRAMVADITRIRTVDGARVFRWGGDWDGDPERLERTYDAMHYEIQASPAELAAGIAWETVRLPAMIPSNPATWPVVQQGEQGPHVIALQKRLPLTPDGVAGPKTEEAIRRYQLTHGLVVDGIWGLQCWTALLTSQPVVAPGQPSPVKLPAPSVAPGHIPPDIRRIPRPTPEHVAEVIRIRGVAADDARPGLEVAEVLLRAVADGVEAGAREAVKRAADALADWIKDRAA